MKCWLTFAGLILLAAASLLTLDAAAEDAAAERHTPTVCPNFERYATEPLPSVDGDKWLEDEFKPVVRIDRRVSSSDLEQSFDCVVARNARLIEQIFKSGYVSVDPDFYQFPASEFSYGRILVNRSSYKDFLKRKLPDNITIMKITFDFSSDGNVVDQDFFVISKTPSSVVYGEFISGVFKKTDRCFECHKRSANDGVFFKPAYAGWRHLSRKDDIRLR